MRWWPPVLTALAGAALTLGAALWIDIQAAQGRIKPEPAPSGPLTVSLGADARAEAAGAGRADDPSDRGSRA